MSAASVVRYYADLADAAATRTGRRDQKVAARRLRELADELHDQAERERLKKQRQRGTASGPAEAVSPVAPRDTESWSAVSRTKNSVTLRRKP